VDDSRHSGLQAFSSLNVDKGLYVLRYVSASTPATCPVAEIHLPADADRRVRLVSAPGSIPGVLAAPGKCVVLVVEAPVTFTIGLRPRHEGGSVDASIRLEPLEVPAAVENPSTEQTPAPQPSRSTPELDLRLQLIAHIARRGDVPAEQGQWLAGPDAPAAIEGLRIVLPETAPYRVEVQALSKGPKPTWSEWAGPGEFVGSKGRARALTGVRFRIAGAAPAGYVLAVDGMFLGSPVQSRRGRDVELVSPLGSDPIVGLRVSLVREAAMAESQATPSPSSKIKIFRANNSR